MFFWYVQHMVLTIKEGANSLKLSDNDSHLFEVVFDLLSADTVGEEWTMVATEENLATLTKAIQLFLKLHRKHAFYKRRKEYKLGDKYYCLNSRNQNDKALIMLSYLQGMVENSYYKKEPLHVCFMAQGIDDFS